jgi:hypothetical protein
MVEKEISAEVNIDQIDEDQEKIEADFQNVKSKVVVPMPEWWVKRDRMVGARSTYQEQIKSCEKELNKQQYKTIDDEYRKMLIQLKVNNMAVETPERDRQQKWWIPIWKNISRP